MLHESCVACKRERAAHTDLTPALTALTSERSCVAGDLCNVWPASALTDHHNHVGLRDSRLAHPLPGIPPQHLVNPIQLPVRCACLPAG